MLLSKGKIKLIHELFSLPYKPSLINTEDQKEQLSQLIEFQNSTNVLIPIKPQYKTRTEELKKSSFPSYNMNTVSIEDNNINQKDSNYQSLYYPLRREINIKSPEAIIESGVLKSSIRKEGNFPSIYDDLNVNQIVANSPPEQPLENQANLTNVQTTVQNEDPQNADEDEIDKIIPGDLTKTVKLDDKELENINETPVVEPTQEKKYKISSGNIVTVPENYSTDDEDEFTAINTLNEDVSSWKQYTDKNGIKLYFKPYPVKDEDGKDVESVIGFCEAVLDFPAGDVINKMNNFEFRKNVDDQYKKGKLLSEKMEGNIKIMEMYLYMKMPFIFSDRDFVVRKKCWLDYNGNKDHALFYIHSIEHPEYPAKKKPVRGNFANRSGYIKPLGDNKCQLNVVTAMDVKMSLGVSTMSKNGAEMQEKWIGNLRKELAK